MLELGEEKMLCTFKEIRDNDYGRHGGVKRNDEYIYL